MPNEAVRHAKAARAGIIEQRPAPARNARPRPVIVENRRHPDLEGDLLRGATDWRKWRAYRTEAEATAAMNAVARKYTYFEYRLAPPAAPTTHQPATAPTPAQ